MNNRNVIDDRETLRPTRDEGSKASHDDVLPALDNLPLLLAVPLAARILGISRAAAYRLVAAEELPARRLGGRVYVITAALLDLTAATGPGTTSA
ncbi:helix-turn-helix domain-containing protein [Antrihabitans stalactiti]|uniref:Helix-turn-helix domain-containing protein n=1 Tax=Antrihabitans stalactiti TaxID=2584121 RepID=A0A848KC58_9NOCA|nr:helix-turn-helix domain-containing protein [Antrihabitans stalactiti]NMN95909.1 helix-turn-helix domain-containing protein [Antrihabitans stalactiti]